MGNVDNFDGHVRNTQNRLARNRWKSKSHYKCERYIVALCILCSKPYRMLE